MEKLLAEIRQCTLCSTHLPLGPRPTLSASKQSKVVVIGQAPGTAVHKSGIAWDDKSGDRLRDWLGVDKELFYNPDKIALIPMGFCYPGRGKSGDLPPRLECAPAWHSLLWKQMPEIKLTILVGQYAQKAYLSNPQKKLTETVRNFADYGESVFPLPHPSPRNNIWMAKNPWFEQEVLPILKSRIMGLLHK